MAKAKKRPSNNKPAEKNQKGLDRIQKAVEQLREEYESKYPFAQDYDAVQTPEGLPTFEEFVLSKSAGRAYNEADPLYGYQKTTQLGPLAFQRWRGAKTSKDGKNYRTPYYVLPSVKATGDGPAKGTAFGSGVQANGKLTLGTHGLVGGFDKYKEGHRRYMEQRSLLDKVKGIPGSIAPPVNYVAGRGASIGGRNIPKIAGFIPAALTGIEYADALKANDSSRAFPLTPVLGATTIGGFANTTSQLVVPTAGLKVNPFGKQVRALKKDARREGKQLDKKLAKGEKYYTRELDKEKSRLEDQMDLYEKRYGVRPTVQDNTMDMPNFVRPAVEARRGQNRNPIFLKDGGIVKAKKK